jgi:hypothetical protein
MNEGINELGFKSVIVFEGQFKKDATAIEDGLQASLHDLPLGYRLVWSP